MSDFATRQAEALAPPPDPHKYVNYSVGMVLSVDDFKQEHAYLAALNQWLARDLIGYGTVSGLQVSGIDSIAPTSKPQINVSAGIAITPQGQLVRITQDQCANINDWLANADHKAKLDTIFNTTSATLKTYVVLCYNNLPTDDVPIPGEPCRDEKDSLRPSRLNDDFSLELRLSDPTVTPPMQPPGQQAEQNRRAFIAFLKQQIQLVNNASALSLKDFEQAINNIKVSQTSPQTYSFASGTPLPLRIPAAQAADYISRALASPLWRDTTITFGDTPQEACLTLAQVDISVSKGADGVWRVDEGSNKVQVLNPDPPRPYLIPGQLLQEWLLSSPTQPPISIVAAGTFQLPADATTKQLTPSNVFNSLSVDNKLTATQLGTPTFFLLEGGFQATDKYLVKGTPLANAATTAATATRPQTFEYVPPTDPGLAALLTPLGKDANSGWVVRVAQANNALNATTTGFMVEISQIA